MNVFIWLCLTLVSRSSVYSMYYTRTKEIFQPPANRHLVHNAYFGYSLTYDESNKTLVISAPNENNIGEVYNCNIENRNCTPIVNSIEREFSNYTHGYWFGASVKAGPNFVVMCAPRFTEVGDAIRGPTSPVTHGKCYLHTNGTLYTKRSTSNEEILHDLPRDHRIEDTMDSFGWSIDVASDDSIIVGGPGMYHGRAMIYEGSGMYQAPKLLKSKVEVKSFGYAVASGNFFGNVLSFAVGSPYGTEGFGEVSFYRHQFPMLRKLQNLTLGVGSMFGAVLCAARLSGPKTDLLVGAPAYATNNTYNLGAVLVYLAQNRKLPQFQRIIVGQVSGSMFGSAIINVGDLNGDQKNEIVISAPFENDGHGIVYLYSGADLISEDRDLKYLQRIEPETSYGESFGLSLTSLLNYGENGCNDLAIGSPYTNTVVLLKCMPAVVVETSEEFPNLLGRTSSMKTNFEFEVCLSVKYPKSLKQITASVITMVAMDHAYAKLASTNDMGRFTFNTNLDDKGPRYCRKVPFILPLDGNYDTKVSYTISSKLLIDPRTLPEFNSSRVILSDRSVLEIKNSFWAADCGGKNVCLPNLMLRTHISFRNEDADDLYTIGSSTEETMYITVLNSGDVAYEPCVHIHPVGVNVLAFPSGCEYEGSPHENKLKCKPLKPIHNNTIWKTGKIALEMSNLTNLDMDKGITINMILFNSCHDVSTETLHMVNLVNVTADSSGIQAKGETDIGAIVQITKKNIQKLGKKMQHTYTITNKGPTNWKNLQVLVTLPSQPYIKYGDISVYLNTYAASSNLYAPCSFVSKNGTSLTYLCQVVSLMKQVEFAKILIPMKIVPGTLDGILDRDNNVTITSSVILQLIGDDYKVERTTTTLMLLEATVPIEMIIIAVVVGLCITIIIWVILYCVGVLRRKKRHELRQLKKYVKHQALMRRSAIQSQLPRVQDQRPILEDMRR